jgi:hypothetical protein
MAHAPPASAVVSSVKAERISPEPGVLGLPGGEVALLGAEVALPGAETEYGESAAGVADRGLEETLVFGSSSLDCYCCCRRSDRLPFPLADVAWPRSPTCSQWLVSRNPSLQ